MFVKVLKSGLIIVLWLTLGGVRSSAALELPEVIPVPGQPVAANVSRLVQALELLGTPLPSQTVMALKPALDAQDAAHIQTLLDPHALFVVQINPESRVKVQRGPARATLERWVNPMDWFGGDEEQRLAEVDHTGHAVGQAARWLHRLRPFGEWSGDSSAKRGPAAVR